MRRTRFRVKPVFHPLLGPLCALCSATLWTATAILGQTSCVAALSECRTAVGTPPPPPLAPVRPVTDDYFGTKMVDPYRYMENLKDPEVARRFTIEDVRFIEARRVG